MMKLTNRNIPLRRLTLSAANVRKAGADPEDDKELQASILSLGVLKSLLVVPNGDDNFDVVAGGRRLAALQQLAEAGKIAADYVAPCRVLGGGADPAEVSLHENEKRAPMHPADQYEAYERLRAKGMTAADIASRAGVSERQVTKMMRLGTVAPELLAAFRNREMNLQTLMAFTVTDDRQAQLDVWAKARSGGATWPEHIRDQLTEGAVIGSSGLASFVGLEAYEKAGGRVQRDLFSQFDDEAVYLLDRGLLMKLAEAELKKTADRLAKRWKWVEIQIEADWERIHTLHQLRGEPGTPTAAERKRLDQLADRMQDIADNPPMDPAEQGNAYARSQELNAKHEKLEARIAARTKYRPEDMRIAGCIVTLKGARADVITGLVLPEDVPPKPKKAARKKDVADAPANAPEADGANAAEGGEEPAAPPPSFDERFEEPWTTRSTRNHQSPEAAHAKAAGLAAAVIDDLAAIRTGIIRAALAKRFDVAFDLAAYLLVMDTSTRGTERPADIRLVRTSLRPMGRNGESDFAAASPGEKLDNPPTGQWMKLGDDLKRFDAFRALPDAEKHDLFARAVSAALHNQAANQHGALPIGERVVELLDIDFATVRPTEKYFWKRLTRARMLEIAEAVVGTEWAKARRNHKKGQLAADMAAVFGDDPQGRAALDAEARERVEQWAMPGFRAWDGPAAKKGQS